METHIPKYKVKVQVKATFEYAVEIDHDSERKAGNEACENYEKHLPEDFRVAYGYLSLETDIEALTALCPECKEEHPLPNDDTQWCSCGDLNGGRHIVVDGVHVDPPWGREDQYCCPSCDDKISDAIRAEQNQSI